MMTKFNIARCMSTQHPDNVCAPFFADNVIIAGDDEIKEAFHAFSHLKIKEQLWDCEGKETDNFVIRKLLTRYSEFFSENRLGRDNYMLLRVPNPSVEKGEGKILLEVLESIPRSFDVSRALYGDDIAPIFEVSVPMVSTEKTLIRIAEYYKRFVHGKQDARLFDGDVAFSKWIGDFLPESIRVMPLFETREAMCGADRIVESFIDSQLVEDYQRVWFARSDPALNYGSLAATLIEKIALQRIHALEERISVELPVMMGVGSSPFRGNFKPTNIKNCLGGYPSLQTLTVQSAFKYDYDEDVVKKAVYDLNHSTRSEPIVVDEDRLNLIIDKASAEYQRQVKAIAPLVNKVAGFVPQRRMRKLHIGLFGYSRKSGDVSLPRAIKFTCACYSMGIPPELLGLSALNASDIEYIRDVYRNFDSDLADSLKYLNSDNLKYVDESVAQGIRKAAEFIDVEVDAEHKVLTDKIMKDFSGGNTAALTESVIKAGWIRKFLG